MFDLDYSAALFLFSLSLFVLFECNKKEKFYIKILLVIKNILEKK